METTLKTDTNIKTVKLYRQNFYTQPVVLIDGITRTGKTMLSPILTSLENVELHRIETNFDRIPRLYKLKKITRDAAVACLRLEMETKLYESMISRSINFRWSDNTGVFNQIKPLRYLKRLFAPEGDVVVEKILKEKPIFQVQTHDVLGINGIYFDAFGNSLRIIEMLRHPVDSIYGNCQRGYGKRESNDPRIFSLNILHGKKLVPWYCYGWEDEYIACESPTDKVIKMCAVRLRRMWKGYESLSDKQKKQVLFIAFDKFATNPEPDVQKMENFIGRKRTKLLHKALTKGRVPRIIKSEEREKKEQDIRSKASSECITIMEDLVKEYEERVKSIYG